jgi:hypothetical protein
MSEITELSKEELSYSDEKYGVWLASEIKKKLQEKNWEDYDKLIKLSRQRIYEVEHKRLKK